MLNLTSLKTPGVYIDEVPKFPPSVASVETAIPAFIGYTERAVKEKVNLHAGDSVAVLRISSFAEYFEYFGDAPEQTVSVSVQNTTGVYEPASVSVEVSSAYRMYYAVRMFYANGGGPCYIISVGPYKDDGSVDVDEMGTNGEEDGGLDLVKKIDEVTILVFPDASGLATIESSLPEGSNADEIAEAKAEDNAAYYSIFNKGLQQSSKLMDRVTLIDVRNQEFRAAASVLRDASLDGDSLKYGAAYTPWLRTLYNYRTTDASVTLSSLPDEEDDAGVDMTLADAKADATHGPRITNAFLAKLNNLLARERVLLPPSSAIAGIYAATDNARGVWKAPANVTIADIIEPVQKISDEDQRDLNIHDSGKSINAIRTFTGKGTLVWGARTLAGNDNEWKYVSVRRFFNMVEESTKKATEPFVFEPNDANTWVKVQAMIENYLNTLWRVGALQGAKPEHAYYVSVGLGKTMTPLDVIEGRMIVEIGMAVVRPAEFIVLRFSHKMPES